MSGRLIINDCLDHGTQIPYIKRAIKVMLISVPLSFELILRTEQVRDKIYHFY